MKPEEKAAVRAKSIYLAKLMLKMLGHAALTALLRVIFEKIIN